MLSTNSSVSAPVESRNHSHMVSAVKATRRRAPGGSFIWPNTMAGCVQTPRPGFPKEIEDAAERLLADRHRHGSSSIDHVGPAHEAVGRAESHAAHAVAAQVLLDFAR